MWFAEGSVSQPFNKLIYERKQPDAEHKDQYVVKPLAIGRRVGDIIYSDDRRVSREHAHIHIEFVDASNVQRPKIFVTDLSKFGTSVNDVRIANKKRHELQENDCVCVGIAASSFTIRWRPFLALFSRIGGADKKAMKMLIHKMGGQITKQNAWSGEVTHLFIPNNNLPLTAKVISAVIAGKAIVTMEWLNYVWESGEFPGADTNSFIPKNLQTWLQTGQENALKYGTKRGDLFGGKMFIFVTRNLLDNHKEIIENCKGDTMLVAGNAVALKHAIVHDISSRSDIDAFAIFHDDDNTDKRIDGEYAYYTTCSIANAILACDANGSENEIAWKPNVKDVKLKHSKQEADDNDDDDVVIDNHNHNHAHQHSEGRKENEPPSAPSDQVHALPRKRKREQMTADDVDDKKAADMTTTTTTTTSSVQSVSLESSARKRRKTDHDNIASVANVAQTQSVSPEHVRDRKDAHQNKTGIKKERDHREDVNTSMNTNVNVHVNVHVKSESQSHATATHAPHATSPKRVEPRKLSSGKFVSIKRLKLSKQQHDSSSSEPATSSSSTAFTSLIHRNLSIMLDRDKQKHKGKPKKKRKPMKFKDVSGKRKLRSGVDGEGGGDDEDDDEDEETMLEKQRELYTESNIQKLQSDVVEMELEVPASARHRNSAESMNESEHRSVYGASNIGHKLPDEAFQQPNFKAFRGNPNALKAIQSRLNNLVEFDLEHADAVENSALNDSRFQQQREEEEKGEAEIEHLFDSRRKAKKGESPTQKRKQRKTTTAAAAARSKNRNVSKAESESLSEIELMEVEEEREPKQRTTRKRTRQQLELETDRESEDQKRKDKTVTTSKNTRSRRAARRKK